VSQSSSKVVFLVISTRQACMMLLLSASDEITVERNRSCDTHIPQIINSSSSSDTRHQTIFVSIAAFRDAECQWTLRDMFLKAAHPDRVTAGVVWQVDPVDDAAFVRGWLAARGQPSFNGR